MSAQPFEPTGLQCPSTSEAFVAALQDPDARIMLAAQLATKGFYGTLDEGATFDDALTFALELAIDNAEYLKDVATGKRDTNDEEGYLDILNDAHNGQAPHWASNRLRRGIARLSLREYIYVGSLTVPLSFRAIGKESRFGKIEDEA